MNKNVIHNGVVKMLLLVSILLFTTILTAQTEKTRTVEKTFDGKTALWASHRYGNLSLKKGSGDQIKAVLKLTATGKNAEELEQFLNEFDLNATEAADNKIDIQTSSAIESWNSTGISNVMMKTTIKLRNGKTYTSIQKFNMTLELYVPKLRYATLENRYDAIKVEEGTTAILGIKLYDGEIDAPGNYDKLNLEMKYSEGRVGNFNNSESELYDCDITMGNGGNLTLKSKYSGVKIGSLQSLKMDTYDDDFKIANVKGAVEIKDKYSEFTFNGDIGDATLDLYDSKIITKNGGDIKVNDSKYTEYSFLDIKSLYFTSSYDDAVQVAKVGTLAADNSKYTEYEVGGLWKEIKFPASYDDAIRVRSVGETFSGLTFEGKYTDITLPIPASVKYEIDAYAKYGEIIFPENSMETTIYKEKNDEVTLQAKIKGADANAPKVNIKSYDGTIKLN
ncbi:MAG: hypothetical protein ACK4TA_17950 [Saprospiraceae bacterium]